MKVVGTGGVYPREKKVRARCRKWQLRVMVEDEVSGTTYPKTRYLEGVTYTEAKAELDAFIDELVSTDTSLHCVTFGKYADAWLTLREESPKFADRTISGNRRRLRHARYHLEDVPISEINAQRINKLYVRLAKGDTFSGNPLSGTSIRDIHSTTMTMLRSAISDGLLDKHALDGVIVPDLDTDERVPLTNEQAARVADALKPTSAMQMIILVCMTCGLRRSEAVALNWADIEDGVIHVRKSVEDDSRIKKPKTANSSRVVPMPKSTASKLYQWRDFQRSILANKGISQGQKTPVFTNTGNRYRPHSVTQWWDRHRMPDYGVDCTVHDLRHTYATMLARQGVHISVAGELVGDKTLRVLAKTYTHVATKEKVDAVGKLDELI